MPRTVLLLAPWLVLLIAWYGVHYSGIVNPALVPSPHAIGLHFIELLADQLPLDLIMSTSRVFAGGLCGIVVAVPSATSSL
jgi:NitT/TauT family transport system permease protein